MPYRINGRTMFNTSEACQMAGTNRDTYLRWVREKRIEDVMYRDRNGWRLFTEDDVLKLKSRVNAVTLKPASQDNSAVRMICQG